MSKSKTDGSNDHLAKEDSVFQNLGSNPSQKTKNAFRIPHRSIQNIGSKLREIISKKPSEPSFSSSSNASSNSDKEMINDHLSNTLGIIKLLSADELNVEQAENIAALKSSCDFLLEKLGIPYPEQLRNDPDFIENKNRQNTQTKSVLLICSHPLQKKVLKNLIQKWGYQIQILSSLPKELSLLVKMKYDLVIIAHGEHNISEDQIKTFGQLDMDFLVLTNGITSMRARNKKFPVIEGPIDPDFLNYKMNKIIKSRRLKENKPQHSH